MKHVLFVLALFWGLASMGQTKSLSDDLLFSFPMDGTATDVSGNSRNGTIVGAVAATTDRFGNPNGALQFNSGTDNKTAAAIDLAYGSVAGQTIGTSNFTTSFWVSYGTTIPFPGIITKERTSVNPNQCRFGGYGDWANTLVNGTGNNWDTVNFSPTLNQWYHYVVVRNAATLSVYINGKLLRSKTNASGTLNHTGLDNYRIGCNQGGLTFFNGKLDDLRMYSRALTANEISALYTLDNLQAYYPLNGDTKDYSGNSFDGTLPATNVTAVADRFGKANSAYYFGGGSSVANIIKTTAKQVAVTNYSVSAWVKMEFGEGGSIVTNRNDGNNTSCRGIALDVTSTGRVRMGVSGVALWHGSTTKNKAVNDGKWHYITGVFSCPSGTIVTKDHFTIYVDGNPITGTEVEENGGTSANATSPLTSDGYTWIGESQDFYNQFSATTKGTIDEVKIYTRSLTPAEIRQQFLDGSASTQGGTLLYYPLDGNTLDYSGNGLDAIQTGTSDPALTIDRFGNANSAYLFKCSNLTGAIKRVSDASINLTSSDCLSFSGWMNLTSLAGKQGNGTIYTNQEGIQPIFSRNGDNFALWYYYPTKKFQCSLGSKIAETELINNVDYVSSLVGQWNHIALTITPTSKKIYVNGNLVLSTTGSYDLSTQNGNDILFGHTGYYPLNGSLDDIRLYKRELSQAEIVKLADDKPNTLVQNNSASVITNPFTTSNVFTAEMWVKPATTPGNFQGFLGNTGTNSSRIVPCMWVNGNNLHFGLNGSAGTAFGGTLPDFFSANQWTHVAWVSDGKTCSFYKNGELRYTCPMTVTALTATANIKLGGADATTLVGQMDEVRVWSTARTQLEIQANMHKELGAGVTGLVASYSFNGSFTNAIGSTSGTFGAYAQLSAGNALRTAVMQPATNITATGFTANWYAVPSATSYQLQYSTTADFASATLKTAATNSFAVTGVDSVYLRVRALLATGDTMAWSNPYRASRLFAPAGLAVSLNPTNLTSDVTAQYVKVPSGAWFKGDFTVSTWVYIRKYNGTLTRIFDFGNGQDKSNVLFDPQRGIFSSYTSAGAAAGMKVAQVPAGKWVNVTITQSSGATTVYYDGVAQTRLEGTAVAGSTTSASCTIPAGDVTTNNYIGKSNWNENYLNMMLDEFCIYNKALTPVEVLARMNQHLTGNEDGLLLYYDFDNINGNNITDRTGKGKDATLQTVQQNLDLPKLVKSSVSIIPTMRAASNITPKGFTANWDAMAGISKYQVQWASKSDFSDASTLQTLTANSIAVTPSYSPVYFRARAEYAANTYSDWGTTAYFTAPGNGIDLQNKSDLASSSGNGQYVQVPAGKWLSGNFTVDAWVYVRDNKAYQRLFDFGTTDGTTGGANNKVLTLTGSDSNNPYYRVATGDVRYLTTTFPLSQWAHIALSNDSTNKTVKVYINGDEVSKTEITSTVVTCTSNFIGRSNWGTDFYANASIDEFRISNQALSRDSIIARSHRHLSGKESDLVLYYDFDQINGDVIPNLAAKTGATGNGKVFSNAPFVDSKAMLSPFIRKVDTTAVNKVTISWDKVPNASYEVQTAQTADFATNYQSAKSITDTAYTTTLAANQSVCFYRVRTTAPFDTSAWQTGVVTIKKRAMQNMAYQAVAAVAANTTDIQIKGGDPVTMSCWAKFSSIADCNVLFQSGNSGKSGKMINLTGAKLQVLYDANGGAGWQGFECPVTISANTWYHFAYSLDANKKMTMYLNGVKYIPVSNSYGIYYDNTLQAAQANADASSQPMSIGSANCTIDNFQIWKGALSQDDIIKYANTPVTGKETDLRVAYNFNQIDGATIADLATATPTPATIANNPLLWKASNAELTPLVRITAANDSSLTVGWGTVPGAISYTLKYATKADLSDAKKITQAATSKLFEDLLVSTNYYFSAKAYTASDSSDWSAPVKGSLLGLNDSLIAYYPFNSSAKDESGNGADGTISSSTAVTPTSDRFGNSSQAYKFDKGYITVPGTKNNLDGSYTIAAWVNSTPEDLKVNSHAVVSKYTWSGDKFDGYMLSLAEGAGQLTQVNTSDPSVYNMDPKLFPLQQWKFICATYSSDKTLTLWIDGDTVLTKKNVAPNVANTLTFYIGAYYNGGNPFQGSIDDIRLYRRPLSKKEIATLYHQGGWPYTGVAISKKTLTEQQDKDTEVGKLRPLLADGAKNTCKTITHKLVAGVGSTDNDKFVIVNDSVLKTTFIFDTTKQRTASIRVQATTCDGIIVEGVVTINIVGNTSSEVYDFNKLTVASLGTQDGWNTSEFVGGKVSVGENDGKDGSKALIYSGSSGGDGFATSKTIASMFPIFESLTQDSIQTTLSYDIFSSAWGVYFGLKTKSGKDVFSLKTTASGQKEYFAVLGDTLPLVNNVPEDWTRVAITFGMIDAKTAELSVRARTLADANSAWISIIAPYRFAVDTVSTNTSASNPKLWESVAIKNYGTDFKLDNIALTKRTVNPSRTGINDGLLAYYNMDNNMRDASGNENHGAASDLAPSPTPAFDRFGQANAAFTFDGTQNFTVADIGKKLQQTNVSFSVWAKEDEIQSSSLFTLSNDINSNRVNAHVLWGGTTMYWDYGNIASDNGRLQAPASFNTDWHHYVFVSGDNGMNIYVDNVSIINRTEKSTFTTLEAALLIGGFNRSDGGAHFFKGSMDDFRIYNRELTPDDVKVLYTEGGWPVQSIRAKNMTLMVGTSGALNMDITPVDAPTTGLIFTSGDTKVATVTNTGVVKGLAVGTVMIHVSTANGLIKSSAAVTVTSNIVPITEITLPVSELTLLKGGSYTFKYTIAPTKNVVTSNIAWSSTNSYAAPIKNGVLTALAPCSDEYVYVYADSTDKKVFAKCKITILPSALPTLSSDTLSRFSLKAIETINGVQQPKDSLKLSLKDFFVDDSVLTYSYSPQSVSTDTIQLRLVNNVLQVYPLDTLSQKLPLKITITATDVDKQMVSKVVYVQMKSTPDEAPKVSEIIIDPLLQFRKTATIDLRKYVIDDYTSFASLVFDSLQVNKRDTATIKNGIVTLTVRPTSPSAFSDTVRLQVYDSRKQRSKIVIPYKYQFVKNSAPVFAKIDTLNQITSDTTIVFHLNRFVSDDFTPTSKLKWSFDPAQNVNIQLKDSTLYLSASSSAWDGTEMIKVYAQDEASAKASALIPFRQIVDLNLSGTPVVDFEIKANGVTSSKIVIQRGTKVSLTMLNKSDNTIGVDSWNWVLDGVTPSTINGSSTNEVQYNTVGLFDVTLYAINGSGPTKVTHQGAVQVVGIMANRTSVCTDSTATLWASDSTAGNQYQWSTGATTASIEVKPTKDTSISVIITKGTVTVRDTVRLVYVQQLTNVADDFSMCPGDSKEINPTGFTSLVWNGTPLSSYTATKAEKITVKALVDAACPVVTDEITVSFSDAPKLNMPTSIVTVCEGSKDTIAVGTKDGSSFQWNQTAGVSEDTLFATAAGNYIVTATLGACKTVGTLTVALSELPQVTAFASATNVCQGSWVTLSTDEQVDLKYTWNVKLDNNNQAKVAAVGNNDYYVTATNISGCSATDSVRVVADVPAKLGVSASPNDTVCANSMVSLSANGSTSYVWSNGVTNNQPFVIATSNKFYVTATSGTCEQRDSIYIAVHENPTVTITASPNDTLCKGDALTLTANGGDEYSWNGTIANGKQFTIDQSTSYLVIVTDANKCVTEQGINIVVNEFNNFALVPSQDSICKGDSVQLAAQNTDNYVSDDFNTSAKYITPSALGINEYSAKGIDANGCSAITKAKVVVKAIPSITNIFKSDTVCKGVTTVLTAQGSASSYAWDNGVENGKTFSPTETKRYHVTATEKGCTDTASTIVVVKGESTISVTTVPNTDTAICKGSSVTLSASSGEAFIVWENNTDATINVTPATDTTYTVIATDVNKCVLKKSVSVKLHALPSVTANFEDSTVCSGTSVVLTGNGATSYVWSDKLADGAARSISGDATFTVTGTDANKCTNTASVAVNALKPHQEQIAVVSNPESGRGVVIAWERTPGKRTASYDVLKLDDKTGKFAKLASRAYIDSNYVHDRAANALLNSYQYKLVTHDSVCNNTDTSELHQTMHLTSSASTEAPNLANLEWNKYTGLDVATYTIYVYNKGVQVDAVSEGNKGTEKYSKTYDKHQAGNIYRIGFKLDKEISVNALNSLKSDSGPYSQSMSNLSEAIMLNQGFIYSGDLSVWPSPATDNATISLFNGGNADVELISNDGSVILKSELQNGEATIDLAPVASGSYLVRVHTASGCATKKISVVK